MDSPLVRNNLKELIIRERSMLEYRHGIKVNLIEIKSKVASYCGTSTNNIDMIYKEYSATSMYIALKLAEYFKCRVEDIFYIDED